MLTQSLFILTFWILGSLREFEILGFFDKKFREYFGERFGGYFDKNARSIVQFY